MASCVLCAQLAHVYCTADAAFLCFDCDKTIHSANVISRGHKRLPVCELCKRSAASVYCQEDAASLCSRCDGEVHNANPLPHTTTPIERAMETGLVRSAGLPYVPSAGSGSQPAPCCAPAPAPVAAEDEVSGVFGGQGASEMPSLNLHSPSDGNTSLAVVPDFMGGAHLHAPPAGTAGPSTVGKGKEDDLDLLDFEAAWLSNMDMGLDLAEFLGFGHDTALDVPGMVPSVPEPVTAAPAMPAAPPALPVSVPAPVQPLPQPQPQHDDTDILNGVLDHDDFVVPSFLPDELSDDEAHPALTMAHQAEALTGKKRSAAIAALPALDTFQAQLPMAVPPQAAVPHMVIAPPPPALDSPSLPPAANVHQSARLAAASAASPTYLNGANLTREQRVARYREKRKNRTFQKTIRYASRKAYAEVRPRIKGRFATKEEVAAFKAAQAAGLLAPDAEFTLV